MTIPEDLKSREIEILQLMAEGLTNREIAERLYIGVETVRWYAKQIYSKLDVSGREEAAEKAESLGLLADNSQSEEATKAKPKHNLPTQLTSFIGREQQISEIIEMLSETRLLTLTGSGGTGKTRLSLKVTEQVANDFADGVYFIDLAPISDSDRVAYAIAQALSIIESGDEAILETLKRAIGQRAILLILDNYEHVIEAASLVSELLSHCLNIKVLVTSREALRVSGEQIFAVPAMTLSEADSEAVSLFVQRSQAVKRHFQLDETNRDSVLEICQRLDGMPLAIELAAAQSRFLTPNAILKRIDNRFQSLKSGSRDAPERQQTLQATLDWSYDLLDDGEKLLFARLSVFRGGRSLEAIEAVCGDSLPIDVFDGSASLVDKSMIRQIEDDLGEPRFVMLETIQEYALERLEEFGEISVMLRRHAQYFMQLVERAAPELRLAQQEYWYTKLDIEYSNLQAAMAWALSGEDAEIGLRTVAALRDYWWYQLLQNEGWHWITQAIEFLEDVSEKVRADVLVVASQIALQRQDITSMRQFAEAAMSIYQALNDQQGIAWVLMHLAATRKQANQESYQMLLDALAIMRNLNDLSGQVQVLNVLGIFLYSNIEDYEQSQSIFEECLRISRQTGERRRETIVNDNLSFIALIRGQIEQAQQQYIASATLAKDLGFSFMMLSSVRLGMVLLYETGSIESACQLLGKLELQEQIIGHVYTSGRIQHDKTKLILHKLIQESPELQAAYEAGRKMKLDEAVAFALQELDKE